VTRYLAALLAVAAAKAFVLAIFGPITAPDTGGYFAFSSAILADRSWLDDAGLAQAALPPTAFRMLGYPVLLALCRALAGEGWRWLAVGLQAALSLAALAALPLLRRPLGLSHRAMLFALFAVATSPTLVLDATLLSDSVHAALITFAVTFLARAALDARPLGPLAALGIGLLLAGAFLLREAMMYLWVVLLPLVLCAAGALARPRGSMWRGGASTVLVLLPLAAAIAGYGAWNKARSGTFFITTGAQTSVLVPLLAAALHDPAIFAGGSPLDEVARQSVKLGDFAEVAEINVRLFAERRLTAPEIAAAASRKYLTSWRDHPAAMMRVALSGLRLNQVFLVFRPVDAARELMLWATGEPSEIGRWKSVAADRRFLPLFLADLACKIVSAAIFAAFLLLPPWRLWREGLSSTVAPVGAALWLLYFGWFAVYALVHIETRYMAPVLPFAVLVGMANLIWIRAPATRSAPQRLD